MSRNRLPASFLFVAVLLDGLAQAHAHDMVVVVNPVVAPAASTTTIVVPQAVTQPEQPGILAHGYRGLFAGSLSGLAVGYLTVRGDGVHHDEWRGLVLGTGIGAITGTGLGLAVGMLDVDGRSWGRHAMRDFLLGVTLGATLGAACGGLAAIGSSEAEHVLYGTAIGALSGAPLGLIAGVLRGSIVRDRRTVRTTVGVVRDVGGLQVWSPGVAGRF